jgi:hypothetical protein
MLSFASRVSLLALAMVLLVDASFANAGGFFRRQRCCAPCVQATTCCTPCAAPAPCVPPGCHIRWKFDVYCYRCGCPKFIVRCRFYEDAKEELQTNTACRQGGFIVRIPEIVCPGTQRTTAYRTVLDVNEPGIGEWYVYCCNSTGHYDEWRWNYDEKADAIATCKNKCTTSSTYRGRVSKSSALAGTPCLEPQQSGECYIDPDVEPLRPTPIIISSSSGW